jgi:hypothetical protein
VQQLDARTVETEFVRDPQPIASGFSGYEAAEWPEPVPLFRGIVAPSLTARDVPRVIGDYAEQFARAGGFDPTGAIASGVVVCAAAVDDAIRLLLPGSSGHFQSARLWSALIGSPGAGKSPIQKVMLAPVYSVHSEFATENARAKQAATKDERVPTRAAFTSDSTIDALSDLLADNPRGILYCVDEFDSWLGQHEAFSRDGGGRNRGEWMRLYDGGQHQVHRVSRGNFFVPNWGASVLTATTPAALKRLAKKLSADGLFQRFMLFAVQPMQDRDASIPHFTMTEARQAFENRVKALYGHRADTVDRPIVRLSREATSLYEDEERRLRLLVESAEAISEAFAGHVAKHIGMLGRVALAFHAASDDIVNERGEVRHPCSANVSGETMGMAIRFMRRAYRHAYAIYTNCLGSGSSMELAQGMARSILADRRDSFNRREMTQRCGPFRGASDWQKSEAFRALEDFGWISGDTLLPEQHGARWQVNPRVHEKFAAEAERARERREAVRAALTNDE